jgi:hypothetical protein
MRFHLRLLAPAALLAVFVGACGSSPATSGPGSTNPAGATQNPAVTTDPVASLKNLGTDLLTPVFGGSIPTPECDTRSDGSGFCRWTSADGATVLDAEQNSGYATVDEWRTAFGTAGFDQEIPGIGAAALGGDNPLAEGFRASTYTATGDSFTVTVTKAGDAAAVKALVTAILSALAS